MKKILLACVAALVAASVVPAQAQIKITEVAPWSSGNSPVGADWFEVTNNGSVSVNITGWKVDDSSNSFASGVALRGVTSIEAGQSVIFIESNASGSNDAQINARFINTWFGDIAPVGLVIGNYGGSGIGLSTGGDAVNLFDSGGDLLAGVIFGASPTGPAFQTFDNAAGLNNTTISQLSVVGVNGAFLAANNFAEIGSPGSIATVAAIPEPEAYALMLAGLGLLGVVARKRKFNQGD